MDNFKVKNIELKVFHTHKVNKSIISIAKSIALSESDMFLARTIALLHDIGRFKQMEKYGTFVDLHSENHAELGVRILTEEKILEHIDSNEKSLILKAINYHNRATLPENEDREVLLFSKLIRDADKVDIYRVTIEYYENKEKLGQNKAIELGLPDDPFISKEVVNEVINGGVVTAQHVNTLNDFKILKMGWIFDLNFKQSIKLVQNEDYITRLYNTIIECDEREIVYHKVAKYIKNRLNEINQ